MVHELFLGRVVVAKVLSAHSTGASLMTVVNGKDRCSVLTGWMRCNSADEIQVGKFKSLRDGDYVLAKVVEQRDTVFVAKYVALEEVRSALSFGNILNVEILRTLPSDGDVVMEKTDQEVTAIGIIKDGIAEGYTVYLVGGQRPKVGDQVRCGVQDTSDLFQPYVLTVE